MRYGKDHKQATRQRIVEAAGRRFKQDGIDGAGVATVMSDAGLTNGAFYAPLRVEGGSRRERPRRPAARPTPELRRPAVGSGGPRSLRPLLPVRRTPRSIRGRLPVGRAARRDRPPTRRHQARLHRRGDGGHGRHRVAPRPDGRRGRSNGRAHALRIDGRHPAARQGADRPRPVRSAPRAGCGDGDEVAGRLRSLARDPRHRHVRCARFGSSSDRSASGQREARLPRPRQLLALPVVARLVRWRRAATIPAGSVTAPSRVFHKCAIHQRRQTSHSRKGLHLSTSPDSSAG